MTRNELKEKNRRRAEFRRAVLKMPPWFLAILIVLFTGTVLTQIVFSRHRIDASGEVAISIKGLIAGGGGDDDPGGEEDDIKNTSPDGEENPVFPKEKPEYESLKWLERISKRSPIGTRGSRTGEDGGKPAPVPVAEVQRKTGGGPGQGRGRGVGRGSPWGNRTGRGRRHGIRRYGGSAASETAVEMGLDWLRRHQAGNGRWDGNGYHKSCVGSGCGENKMAVDCDVGLTGLALMAFLGAGYTHKDNRHRRTVRKGLQYLIAEQKPDGSFSGKGNMRAIYSQSMAIIALAEAYGLTRDPVLREPLERATRHLLRAQQARGGWTYTPFPKIERNDTSITGFAVMALRAVREAGLDLGGYALERARRHIDRMTHRSGEVVYADTGTRAGDRGAGMVAVGLFTSLLLGRSPDHPVITKQANILRAHPPSWNGPGEGGIRKRYHSISNSMYYWYYATLAMFSLGGEHWEWWNTRIRDLLVARQRKDGCARGSWNPEALWAEDIGRVYSTAINVLTLEIYYRFIPGFLLGVEDGEWTAPREEKESRSKDASPPSDEEKDRLKRLRDLIGGK
jgi:hypothetical protein